MCQYHVIIYDSVCVWHKTAQAEFKIFEGKTTLHPFASVRRADVLINTNSSGFRAKNSDWHCPALPYSKPVRIEPEMPV